MSSLNLKQIQQQKQLLKLSPQQVQLMKLMQVPVLELEQRIKEELQNNPALEEGEGGLYGDEVSLSRLKEDGDDRPVNDDDSASDARTDTSSDTDSEDASDSDFDVNAYLDSDRDDYAYRHKSDNYPDRDDGYRAPVRVRQGLQEQLCDELGMLSLSEQQRRIGEVIIGNIDGDGYLQRSVEAMVNDMAFSLNLTVTEEEVRQVLQRVQTLEPSGVGARSLKECLQIQLRNKTNDEEADLAQMYVLQNAQTLLEKAFDDFIARRYTRLSEKLQLNGEDVKDAVELIKTLDPKPGRNGGDSAAFTAPVVIPDFYLVNEDGDLQLTLSEKNDPNLRLSPSYSRMLEQYGAQAEAQAKTSAGKELQQAALFVKQKIEAARWFMEMVYQRRITMFKVMQAVLDFQHDYFLEGDIRKLKPMRLKDIAPAVGVDVSTVSRVINNKYIQTHFGTFPVKKFFSQGVENADGEEISNARIKAVLKDLIDGEDKTEPLTDDQLVALLRERGFNTARRTVAKYRDAMDIPVARLRKQL